MMEDYLLTCARRRTQARRRFAWVAPSAECSGVDRLCAEGCGHCVDIVGRNEFILIGFRCDAVVNSMASHGVRYYCQQHMRNTRRACSIYRRLLRAMSCT